jgi:hypothetical protein
VPAIKTFLKSAFNKLRLQRTTNLPVNAGMFDIERVLANFISDHSTERLLTNHFKRPGPNSAPKIVWMPRKISRLAIHVGQANHKMRLDKFVFDEWCHTRGFSSSDVMNMLEHRWGAKLVRTVLGDGTDFAGGRVPCIEIPLIAPELTAYNYDNDSKGSKQ